MTSSDVKHGKRASADTIASPNERLKKKQCLFLVVSAKFSSIHSSNDSSCPVDLVAVGSQPRCLP